MMIEIEIMSKRTFKDDFEKNKSAADSIINFNSVNPNLIGKYLDWVENEGNMKVVFAKIYEKEGISVVGIDFDYFSKNLDKRNSNKNFNNSLYSKMNFIRNKKEVQKLQEK